MTTIQALPLQPGASGGSYIPREDTFEVLTAKPLVGFLSRAVQPPSRVYLSAQDTFLVQWFANFVGPQITVRGRLLKPDGSIVPFQQTFPTASPFTSNGGTFKLAEGFLLSLSVQNDNQNNFSQWCYCTVDLQRPAQGPTAPFDRLAQGYVNGSNLTMAWPQSSLRLPDSGQGTPRVWIGTMPAAGSEISETVPTGVRWKLKSFDAFLNTSVAAATRQPYVQIRNASGQQIITMGSPATVGAAGTLELMVSQFGVNWGTILSTIFFALPDVYLEQGWKITTGTGGLQAGDQYTAPVILVNEYAAPGL